MVMRFGTRGAFGLSMGARSKLFQGVSLECVVHRRLGLYLVSPLTAVGCWEIIPN